MKIKLQLPLILPMNVFAQLMQLSAQLPKYIKHKDFSRFKEHFFNIKSKLSRQQQLFYKAFIDNSFKQCD